MTRLIYNGVLVLVLAVQYAIGMRVNLIHGSARFGLAGDWFLVTMFVLGVALSRVCATPLERTLARRGRIGWVVGAHLSALVLPLLLTSASLAVLRSLFGVLDFLSPGRLPDMVNLWSTSDDPSGYLMRALTSLASLQLLLVVVFLAVFAIFVWPSRDARATRRERRRSGRVPDVADERKPRAARQGLAATYVGMFTGLASLIQGYRAEWLPMLLAVVVGVVGVGALLYLGRSGARAVLTPAHVD